MGKAIVDSNAREELIDIFNELELSWILIFENNDKSDGHELVGYLTSWVFLFREAVAKFEIIYCGCHNSDVEILEIKISSLYYQYCEVKDSLFSLYKDFL